MKQINRRESVQRPVSRIFTGVRLPSLQVSGLLFVPLRRTRAKPKPKAARVPIGPRPRDLPAPASTAFDISHFLENQPLRFQALLKDVFFVSPPSLMAHPIERIEFYVTKSI
jgi:hypothetical protein